MSRLKVKNEKLKMKVKLIIVVAMLSVGIAHANTSLDLGIAGVGARPLGMGRAYVAIADDANAVFTNPAGLGFQKNWALTSMSTQLYNSTNYALAGAAIPSAYGTFGIGYIGIGILLMLLDMTINVILQLAGIEVMMPLYLIGNAIG